MSERGEPVVLDCPCPCGVTHPLILDPSGPVAWRQIIDRHSAERIH
jgi:hypothetical protein